MQKNHGTSCRVRVYVRDSSKMSGFFPPLIVIVPSYIYNMCLVSMVYCYLCALLANP